MSTFCLEFQQTIEANKETQLKTDILPNGIYIVNLINNKGENIKTQKLVIVK